MTPEERARADAINDAISRFSKARKQPRLPTPIQPPTAPRPTIPDAPRRTGNAFRYAAIFAFVLAAHIAGFMAYRHHSETEKTKEAERRAEIQALANAREQAAQAAAALAQANAELARAEAERLKAQLAAQIKQTSPKIEYNVYEEPKPAPQPRPVTQPRPTSADQLQRQTPPKEDAPTNRIAEHRNAAQRYLVSQKSDAWRAQILTTEQVSGWEGRYRTEFEIPRNPKGISSPIPRRYDVLTQEKDGKITGIDITTKGY